MKFQQIIFRIILSISILLSASIPSFAISVALKVESDYKTALNNLQFASIAVDNFANENQKKKYNDLKMLFAKASEEFYSQNFESSFKKFITLKEELAALFEELVNIYLKRSEEILDSTTKTAFDILITYRKDSSLAKSFRKPFNPVENVKTYNTQEYHYFHDRDQIEKYLNKGYKKLNEAKTAYNDPDFEYAKNKKNKSKFNQDFILRRYVKIISFCREAKMYGLEIHKIFNDNKTGDMLVKYNISENKIEPIFDERIPEIYRVDAVDNEKISYPREKQKQEINKKIN